MTVLSLDDFSGAEFSPCGNYRYKLWRMWARSEPVVLFLMLNPSTADRIANDPTIRRCQRFAELWGYGSLHVANVFAYRTPAPTALLDVPDPVGPVNDDKIDELTGYADRIIVAWGKPLPALVPRIEFVSRYLLSNYPCFCMGVTKDGHPCHPLYLPYTVRPMAWVGYNDG